MQMLRQRICATHAVQMSHLLYLFFAHILVQMTVFLHIKF